MAGLSLRGKITLAIALVAVMMFAVAALIHRSFAGVRETTAWTEHSFEVIAALRAVQAEVLDLENGQRAYLLTGDEPFLKPHLDAKAALAGRIEALTSLTSDNARQQSAVARLHELVSTRIQLLDRALTLRREQGLDAAIGAIRTGEGKRVMDEIRQVLAAMEREEYRLLDLRHAQEQGDFNRYFGMSQVGVGVALLFLLIIGYLIRDDFITRAQLQTVLRLMAYRDPLTGLPNRAALFEQMRHAIARAQRHSRSLALMYFDLDGFKTVNDRYGHHVGDELLKELGNRVTRVLRSSDMLARLGGDEFVIMLDEIAPGGASVVARELLDAVALPFAHAPGQECRVAASIGISVYPEHGTDPETLLRHADAAMYAVKAHGRNGYQYFRGAPVFAGASA